MKSALNGVKKLVHARCEDNSGSRTPRGNNAGGGENQIASQAERLTQEAVAAEEEISRRPELLKQLGLPTALCRVLAEEAPMTPAAGCVIRFDFHHTTQGWRISEANSDVPGGFSEASYFTGMMAEHFPGLRPAGNPADVWSTALAAAARQSGVVALLSAPGHMEDHQVIAFLSSPPFLGHSSHEQDCLERLRKASGGQRKTGRRLAIRGQEQ